MSLFPLGGIYPKIGPQRGFPVLYEEPAGLPASSLSSNKKRHVTQLFAINNNNNEEELQSNNSFVESLETTRAASPVSRLRRRHIPGNNEAGLRRPYIVERPPNLSRPPVLSRPPAALLAEGQPQGPPQGPPPGFMGRFLGRLLPARPAPPRPSSLIPVAALPQVVLPPAVPRLRRTPSMLISGTVSALEVANRIQEYIDLFLNRVPHPINAASLLTSYRYTDDSPATGPQLERLYNLFPILIPAEKAKKGAAVASGTYGSVFLSSDPDTVIKVVSIEEDPYGDIPDTDYIAETLINYILQTDPEHPEYVPHIKAIYNNREDQQLWIVMDRLDKTIWNEFEEERLALGKITYPTFKNRMMQILRILIYFNQKYGFVHRDLKSNNIMLKGDTVKLIDFGFAAINVMAPDDSTYRIASGHFIGRAIPCRARQDVASMFYDFYENRVNFDDKVNRFLFNIIPLTRQAYTRRNMYNRRGNILSCPDFAVLNPETVLARLEALAGGRRRRTRCYKRRGNRTRR